MAEQENTSMYHVPASQEAVVVRTPEATLSEAELAYQQAMESAVSTHELDPTDIDRRRVESLLGSSTLVAAEMKAQAPQLEVAFDPRNIADLVRCGQHIVRMRNLKKGDVGLAA